MGAWENCKAVGYTIDDIVVGDLASLGYAEGGPSPALFELNVALRLLDYAFRADEPGNSPRDNSYVYRAMTSAMSHARMVQTRDGAELMVFPKRVADSLRRCVRRREEDDLLQLQAKLPCRVDENGALLPDASGWDASSVWDGVVCDLESLFLVLPRRGTGFRGLLTGVSAITVLTGSLELYRRMLLAAARAYERIARATVGWEGFAGGMREAEELYRVAMGGPARYLARVFARLAEETPGMPPELAAQLPEGAELEARAKDGSWIAPCARLGWDLTAWMLDHSGTALNFAEKIGVQWPGPAVFGAGVEDGLEAGMCLCRLLFSPREKGRFLAGSTVTPLVDGCVELPDHYLEDETCLLACVRHEGGRPIIACWGRKRLLDRIAWLIACEQEAGTAEELCGCPDADPADGGDDSRDAIEARPDAEDDELTQLCELMDGGPELEVADGRLDLRELDVPGLTDQSEVLVIGMMDHVEIAPADFLDHVDRVLDELLHGTVGA